MIMQGFHLPFSGADDKRQGKKGEGEKGQWGVLIGTGWNAPSAAPATPPYGVHVVQNHCAGEDETTLDQSLHHRCNGGVFADRQDAERKRER